MYKWLRLVGTIGLAFGLNWLVTGKTSAKGRPNMDANSREVATLGGGCFWCLEAVFDELKGVESVVSGYSGGNAPNPDYQAVSSGTSGYAEVVQITFDPTRLAFRDLLKVFFTIHDPTTLNRQGADTGPQYRSVVFYHSPFQRDSALAVVKEIDNAAIWDAKVVTQIEPLKAFYPAEEYHQKYFARNPNQGYCRIVIVPKVAKFRKQFIGQLKARVTHP